MNHFIVIVVPSSRWTNELSCSVANALGSKMGPGIKIEVNDVEASQLIAGPGKFRPVIPLTSTDPGGSQ